MVAIAWALRTLIAFFPMTIPLKLGQTRYNRLVSAIIAHAEHSRTIVVICIQFQADPEQSDDSPDSGSNNTAKEVK